MTAYTTVAASTSPGRLAAAARADVITFTSSSTVDRYVEIAGTDGIPGIVACIGPVTAATARGHGLHVDIEASVHSIDGLVAAIVDVLGVT